MSLIENLLDKYQWVEVNFKHLAQTRYMKAVIKYILT